MSETIDSIKIKLYDAIELQAAYQAEFNKLETTKTELAKQLGEARQAAESKKAPKARVDDD